MRTLKTLFLILALLDGLETAHAQRKYTVGSQIDFAAGRSTWLSSGQTGQSESQRDLTLFYSAYPSIELKSAGNHSLFEASYVYGFNRTNTSLVRDNGSHTASASFKSSLNGRWRLNLAESFEIAPDLTTLNVFRGVVASPEGFQYLFYPKAARSSSQINNASGSLDCQVSEKSTLSFGAAHSLRNYDQSNPLLLGRLSDQQRIEANIIYARKTSERSTWGLEYASTYYGFQDFDSSLTHRLSVRYSHELSPTLSLRVAAGNSLVKALGSHGNYAGYNASLTLQKLIKPNILSFYYSRSTGEGTGLGSVSDTHRGGFAFVREFGRKTSLTLDTSTFESRGRLDNPYRTRGASAAATIGVALNDSLSLNFGGQYQRYDQVAIFGFEEMRVFTSLRFRAPELWRFAR